MKKVILPLAVASLFISLNTMKAQDIDYNATTFQYFQLPKKPVDKSIKTYESKVVLKYMEDINSAKGSYQDQVKKADEDYQKAMENYYVQQKLADDQYNKELEIYNKKSLAEKILLGDNGKPQKKYISQPYKQMPVAPKFQKSFDADMLRSKYFKLEGFNQGQGGLTITVKLLGFDSPDPEMLTSTTNTTNAQKQQVTITKYKYAVKYKHPIGYSIEYNGSLLYEDYPVDMTNYSTVNTQEFDNQGSLQSYWNGAKDGFLSNLQEKIVNENCQKVGNMINDMFGYRQITYTTEVMIVDEKTGYQDLKDAYAAALAGYNALISDMAKTAAIPNIQKAVDLWENAMKESNPDSKKARIDRGITKVLLVNLQQAYMWLDNYDKAQACYDKLMAMDPDRDNRHRAERLKAMSADLKERWMANKQ
jgi:hypothetical protein